MSNELLINMKDLELSTGAFDVLGRILDNVYNDCHILERMFLNVPVIKQLNYC